jgi:hypothetical protein
MTEKKKKKYFIQKNMIYDLINKNMNKNDFKIFHDAFMKIYNEKNDKNTIIEMSEYENTEDN